MSGKIKLVKYALAFLRYQGMYPRKNQSFKSYIIQFFCVSVLFLPSFVAPLTHTIYLFTAGVKMRPFAPDIFENISVMSSCVAFFCIAIRFVFKQRNIAKIIRHLEDYSEFGRPDDLDQTEKNCSIYGISLSVYVAIACFMYTFFSVIMEREICETKNEKYGTETICGMFTRLWFPFSIEKWTIRGPILALQILSAWAMVAFPSLMNFVIVAIVLHVNCRIRHFNKKVGQVFEVDDAKIQNERLTECIRYHIDIIKVSDDLNKVSRYMMMVFVTLVSIIFSVIGIRLLIEFSLGAFGHIIGWIILTLGISACGQSLTDSSTSINTVVYNAQWYNAEVRLQKSVLIMLMRSQKNINLNTLTFGVVNFATFQAVVNTAYSYLALLRNTI